MQHGIADDFIQRVVPSDVLNHADRVAFSRKKSGGMDAFGFFIESRVFKEMAHGGKYCLLTDYQVSFYFIQAGILKIGRPAAVHAGKFYFPQDFAVHSYFFFTVVLIVSPALTRPPRITLAKMPSRGIMQSPTCWRMAQAAWHSLPIWVISKITSSPPFSRVPMGR